jgi:HAD superfamily hydrolase (TIGR01509 family)
MTTSAGCLAPSAWKWPTDMPIRALFLDFDGLICDTEAAAWRSWTELYALCGLAFPPSVWTSMAGHQDGEQVALADLAGRLGRPIDTATRAARRRRKYELCRSEPLRPGVADLLALATDRGLTLAVVSSSARSWVEPHLTRLGVRDWFGAVVTGDQVARPKPAPDVYRQAMRLVDLPADALVAFEDLAVGVRAARAAGIYCVAVPNAVSRGTDLSGAAEVLPTLAEYSLDVALGRRDWCVAR